jgi:microcystin-dependent protein
MSEPFISEIRIMSFSFPPKGWAFCNGQLLPINQNQALFSLLGTTYGGDGRVNFALPDVRGRAPFHMGPGFTLGQRGGEENHTLNLSETPTHAHSMIGSSNTADQNNPSGNYWAVPGANTYATSANGGMNAGAITTAGSGQPHQNLSPFLTLSFCIALQGIFPSQN